MSSLLTFRWPWAFASIIVLALLAFLAWQWSARHARRPETVRTIVEHPDTAAVWNLDRDLDTEHTSARWRLWKTVNRLAAALLALTLIMAIVLTARPSKVDSESSAGSSRDIILCLDVSGSTLPYDRQVIATYLDLIQHFQGERIGLSIFNSTSRTVFPLTDDYDLVERQLSYANTILKGVVDQDSIDKMSDKQYQQVSDWLDGTQNRKDVTSLIGDGLVSCAAMLPEFSTSGDAAVSASARNRSASIVLATDNVLSGTPVYQLDQALDLTQKSSIVVDGLYSGPTQSENDQTTTDMKTQIEAHDGIFLTQASGSSVDALVRRIERQRETDNENRNQSNLVDAPQYWVPVVLVLFAAFVIVAGRLRR